MRGGIHIETNFLFIFSLVATFYRDHYYANRNVLLLYSRYYHVLDGSKY